jgi:predicted small lipoprotein YifL
MTLRNIKNLIWMVLCLAALAALTGCQSGSPLDLNDEALNDSQNVGEAPEPIVNPEPVLPKEAAEYKQVDPGHAKLIEDVLFDLRHIPLESGDNNDIDQGAYMYQSDNVTEEEVQVGTHIEIDEYGNMWVVGEYNTDVILKSTTGEMSYVTYGFKNIPEGEEIIKVTVRGTMNTQMFNPFGGLYIGVSDYDNGNFRWFGPLGTECEYELNLWNIDTTNSKQRAYVTLAVYNGDHYTVQDIDVRVGKQLIIPGFNWDLLKFKKYYDEFGILQLNELKREFFEEIPGDLPLVKQASFGLGAGDI